MAAAVTGAADANRRVAPIVRILVAIAVLLAGALIGGLALLPGLVSWDDYRDELTRQAETITGQTVAIAGRIDLELLPRPTLTLARATLSSLSPGPAGSNPAAGLAGRSLVVDRLDLRLKPLPLLHGEFVVDSVRLVRPVLRVEAPHASRASALLLVGGGLLLPLGNSGPSRLTVVDGRALVAGGDHGAGQAIDAINFEVGAAGPNGPYTLDGEFVIAAQRVRGHRPSGSAPPGQLEHAATGGDRARGGQRSDHPELSRPDLVGPGGPAPARRPVAEREQRRSRPRRARPRAGRRPGRRAAGAAGLARGALSSGRPPRFRGPPRPGSISCAWRSPIPRRPAA